MSIDQIVAQALRLSPHDRAVLAETLWESLEDPYTLAVDRSEKEAIHLAIERDRAIEQKQIEALEHDRLMSNLRA